MGETGVAEQYRDQGYFIVEDAVEPKMLDLLENAARRVVEQVRSGAVVDAADGVRTAGEGVEPQFISGLIAPEFGEPVFADYPGSEVLMRNLRPLLGALMRDRWGLPMRLAPRCRTRESRQYLRKRNGDTK